MNITRTDLGDLVSKITVTLQPEDYAKKFNQKLQSAASKASIKGFRKGKVPTDVIKKMYGHSVFGELLDEMFSTSLTEYVKENNISYVAQPILAEGQEQLVVELNKDKDYVLSYELGILPDFEIKGISSTDSYKYFVPEPSETFVEDELKYLSRRLGQMQEVEDTVQEEDLVYTHATQLENGTPKEGGIDKDAIIFVQSVEDQGLKNLLLTKKAGDTFEVEIAKIDKENIEYIKKNILGVSADTLINDDDIFSFVINKVSRMNPAELTDEIIKEKVGLENMEDLKSEILKSHKGQSTPASESLLKKELMDKMLADTNIQISETFTRSWLKRQDNLADDKVEEELPKFIQELKWTYIKDKIARENEITVSNDEIRQGAALRIRSYEAQYGRLPEDMVKNIVKQWYSDRNEMFNLTEEVKTNKIFQHLFTLVQKDEQLVSSEEFDKLFETEENK
jgi:trigger factor